MEKVIDLNAVFFFVKEEDPKYKVLRDFASIVEGELSAEELMRIPLSEVLMMAENIDDMIEIHFGKGHMEEVMQAVLEGRSVKRKRRVM